MRVPFRTMRHEAAHSLNGLGHGDTVLEIVEGLPCLLPVQFWPAHEEERKFSILLDNVLILGLISLSV